MIAGRVLIIPFLHGKLAPDGTLVEPDIDAIFRKWLERHPEFQGGTFHIIRTKSFSLSEDADTSLVRVTADISPDLAAYDPAEDADLYQEFLVEAEDSSSPRFHKIWTEQCEAARGIEDEFGTDKALKYLVEDKFIDFLEAAEQNADFRAEIPAFVAEIKTIFEPWQLRECLETARQTEPFNSVDYMDEEDMDAEDIEMERKSDIRRCAADLWLVERAKEWLLEDGQEQKS